MIPPVRAPKRNRSHRRSLHRSTTRLESGEVLPELLLDNAVLVTDPPYGDSFESGMSGVHARADGPQRLRHGRAGCGTRLAHGRRGLRSFSVTWSIARLVGTTDGADLGEGKPCRDVGDLSLPWKPNTEEGLRTRLRVHRPPRVKRPEVQRRCWIASAIWEHGRASHHVTEKPVDLMRACDREVSLASFILDPFMGSGSDIRAPRRTWDDPPSALRSRSGVLRL